MTELRLKADLVVLSACETGIGKKVHGEGVIGLLRSLQHAGARSVIASQWKIADATTGQFMMTLHQELISGTTKSEALHSAMTATQQNKATSHPDYWAAFFLSGDTGGLHRAAK